MSVVMSFARAAARLLDAPLPRSYTGAAVNPRTPIKRLLFVVLLLLLLAAPLAVPRYGVAIGIALAIGVIGAVATNMLIGMADQASIGNAAFMAIGAFAAAVTALELQLPFFIALPMGALASGAVGLAVGIPAIRVRGVYLVTATLALHFVALYLLQAYQSATVGVTGFIMPSVALGPFTSQQTWYYLVLGTALLALLGMRNVQRSRYGRAWTSLARDEIAAAVMGVDVRRQKIIVFGLSSAMIGFQGALFGYYVGVVTVDPFNLELAVTFIAMIIIGGQGSAAGSLLGALFVVGLPYLVTWFAGFLPAGTASALTSQIFDFQAILYGLAIVVFLVVEPRGLIHLWQRLARAITSWPLPAGLGRRPEGS